MREPAWTGSRDLELRGAWEQSAAVTHGLRVAFRALGPLTATLALVLSAAIGGSVGVLRSGNPRPARVALPLGVALAVVVAVGDLWSPLVGALGVAIAAAAVVLAYRIDRPGAWNVVALFAVGGVVFGYGLLSHLLCSTGVACGSSTLATIAQIAGGGVAVGALGHLYQRALAT